MLVIGQQLSTEPMTNSAKRFKSAKEFMCSFERYTEKTEVDLFATHYAISAIEHLDGGAIALFVHAHLRVPTEYGRKCGKRTSYKFIRTSLGN